MQLQEAHIQAEECHFIIMKTDADNEVPWVCRCLEYPWALGEGRTGSEAFEDCFEDTIKQIIKSEG